MIHGGNNAIIKSIATIAISNYQTQFDVFPLQFPPHIMHPCVWDSDVYHSGNMLMTILREVGR
jgi:hypothetical protein